MYEEVKLHEPGRYHLGVSWHLYEMLFFIAACLHGMEDAEQNMMERVLIDLNIVGLIMFERYLGKGNVIGATATESSDNGLLLMYSSVDGKHFLKSYDKFRTISEEWTVPLDSLTASANL